MTPEITVRHDPKWTTQRSTASSTTLSSTPPPPAGFWSPSGPGSFIPASTSPTPAPGIPEEHYHDVFKRFYRGAGDRFRGGGSAWGFTWQTALSPASRGISASGRRWAKGRPFRCTCCPDGALSGGRSVSPVELCPAGTDAGKSGSRAREGPGEFQRQSLWSIKVKLCRCHKGSETNILLFY